MALLIPDGIYSHPKRMKNTGASTAQSIKRLTLDSSQVIHDLTVCEFKPHVELCAGSAETACDSLSLPVSASPLFFLSQNK